MNAWEDPRIARGMTAQFATRRARIAAGEKPHRLESRTRRAGGNAAARPHRAGRRLPHAASAAAGGREHVIQGLHQAGRRMRNRGADGEATWLQVPRRTMRLPRSRRSYRPSSSPISIRRRRRTISTPCSAADIYSRHVIFGGASRAGGGVAGLTSRLIRRGVESASTTDPEALTGKLTDIVAHVANTLAAYRREAFRRRRHHYRLDHAADHAGRGRNRPDARARSDRRGFRSF